MRFTKQSIALEITSYVLDSSFAIGKVVTIYDWEKFLAWKHLTV